MAESDIFVSNDVEMDVNFGEVFVIDQGVVYKIVASKYNNTTTYVVGAYVVHLEKLYRCITAIEEPEEFDAEKWTQVLLANEVQIANANIALKANADDVYDKTAIDGKVSDINAAIALKANSADVYAKTETYNQTEVDNALATKADADTTYSKTEVDDALALKADVATTYNKTEVDNALATKADAATTYTKTEVDTALLTKADSSSVYSKSDTDTLLAAKADVATTYTKTEVDNALASKANSADVYAKTETYSKTEIDTNIYTKTETYNKTEVDNKINNLPAPMQFKGTLGTGGTVTDLPTASISNDGFTYKVITDGTYASIPAKVGDMFTSNGSEWVHIPSGDETFTDTWRGIKVNGAEKLGSSINTGSVDFKDGTNSTAVFDPSDSSIKFNVDGYTQAQVDAKLADKANVSDVYAKSETYSQAEVDSKLLVKADSSDVYTKQETYTKTEVNTALSEKADTSAVTTALALKADKADTYTKEEVDDKFDEIDPIGTASGAIASFEANYIAPLNSLKCEITAKQDLHGYNSPWIDSDKVNKAPYLNRTLAGTAERIGNYEYNKLVGGTVAFNQLVYEPTVWVQNYKGFKAGTSFVQGHKILMSVGGTSSSMLYAFIYSNIGGVVNNSMNVAVGNTAIFNCPFTQTQTVDEGHDTTDTVWIFVYSDDYAGWQNPSINVIDLTQMFGSTIADYIYSLEQANTGAGVAYFRALFSADYYPYNAGELISVKPTAHITRDGNNNIISNTTLDSDIELRGIPKLDENNKLYYDGDTYSADGSVSRKYGIVDLGSLNWIYTSGANSRFETTTALPNVKVVAGNIIPNALCSIYKMESMNNVYLHSEDKILGFDNYVWIYDSSVGTDANAFKTAMSGKYLVYELASTTTETADAFTNPQAIDSNGSEEFTDSRAVAIPVGHESYYANICPIVGHSELNLTRCGVNLFDDAYVDNNLTAEQILPAGTYYIKAFVTGSSEENRRFSFYFNDTWNVIANEGTFDDGGITWSGSTFGWLYGNATATVILTHAYKIRASVLVNTYQTRRYAIYDDNSITQFIDYNGQTFTVAFGQTVYGGVYDKSGRLTITWGAVDLGSLDWSYNGGIQIFYTYLDDRNNVPEKKIGLENVKCSIYHPTTHEYGDMLDGEMRGTTDGPGFNIKDLRYSDTATFKTAMSGIILAYELATPIVVDVPSISVSAENGTNNIISDGGGDVDVEYYTDLVEDIKDFIGDGIEVGDLANVEITTPSNDQVLKYDSASQKWVNGNSSGGSAHNYSTTEQVVGTWVDGSPVYEKTVYSAGGVTGNFDIPHNVSNLDRVISYSGTVKDTDFSTYHDIWTIPRLDDCAVGIDRFTTTVIKIVSHTDFNNRLVDWYITFRYTKST